MRIFLDSGRERVFPPEVWVSSDGTIGSELQLICLQGHAWTQKSDLTGFKSDIRQEPDRNQIQAKEIVLTKAESSKIFTAHGSFPSSEGFEASPPSDWS